MSPTDIAGQTFGFLTAIRYTKSVVQGGQKRQFWLFRCVCGEEFEAQKGGVTGGKQVSCGCRRRENIAQNNEKRRQAAMTAMQNVAIAKEGGLTADQLANRAAVPPSMRNLPGRLIQARHVDGHSVGVPLTGKGVSSIAMEETA